MKVCRWCAEELLDDARTCSHCGRDPDATAAPTLSVSNVSNVLSTMPEGTPAQPTPLGGASTLPDPKRDSVNRYAVASLVAVLFSFVMATFPHPFRLIGLALDVAAVVLGVLALREIERTGQQGNAAAWVGIVLGALGIAAYLPMLVFFLLAAHQGTPFTPS